MDITGKIIHIGETQQISDKFRKRVLVVEYATNPQFPELISFEMVQDNVATLDNFAVGQEAQIFFDLKGRKWVDRQGVTKYFNSLQAWRLTAVGEDPGPSPYQEGAAPAGGGLSQEEVDKIPFGRAEFA